MKYLSDKDLGARYGVHRATPWRWVESDDFPAPVRITQGCTRWRLADIEAWEKQKGLASTGGAA